LNNSRTQSARDLWFSPIEREDWGTAFPSILYQGVRKVRRTVS